MPWVLWSRDAWTARRGKRPVMRSGRAASSTDRRSWGPWEAVRDVPHGIMLGDGLACWDLDHCLDADGVASVDALAVLARVEPLWVERSMSGDGLHVFVAGAEGPGWRVPGIEYYSRARFIAVTGDEWRAPRVARVAG